MRRNNEKAADLYSTLDAYVAAFLTLHGLIPRLVDQDGKIVFVFVQSDELSKELANYNAGASVDASKFAFTIKVLKSRIHSMRREKETAYVKREKEK